MEMKMTEENKTAPETITAFKAFGPDWKCRGFAYEVGKTYEHDGKIKACESGFHACENPLDVLNYYDLCDSKFATVELSGEISRHGDDSKIASAKITVKAELGLPKFIDAAVSYLMSLVKSGINGEKVQAASGNSSKLAASGNYSQLAASGYYSQLAASGDSSQLAASGKSAIAMAAAPGCTAKVGENGCIALTRWVESEKRFRVSVAYVGEDGIKQDVWYSLDDEGKFVEAAALPS